MERGTLKVVSAIVAAAFLSGSVVSESALANDLKIGWGSGLKRVLKVKYGSKVTLMGRLLDDGGSALAFSPILIEKKTDQADADWVTVGQVTTDSQGQFQSSFGVLPSSTFRATHNFSSGLLKYSAKLKVRGRVSLSIAKKRLKNLDTVVFKGRVKSAGVGLPVDGKTVSVQFYDRFKGTPVWSAFEVGSTNSKGRFNFRHKFTTVTKTTVYAFRAYLPAEYGWPFLDGYSKSVNVSVAP